MAAVILGAFGAHSLKEAVDATQLGIFEKGVTYQFYHSFALLATGIIYQSFPQKALRLATVFFALGILLFSGSLYLMVGLTASGSTIGAAGIITPIGGLCFIIGWIMLLAGVLAKK
ncbi:MAG: DUF423 domain-containing protein [Chitinophagaceae bacterium]